jgi:hypothetical protein
MLSFDLFPPASDVSIKNAIERLREALSKQYTIVIVGFELFDSATH